MKSSRYVLEQNYDRGLAHLIAGETEVGDLDPVNGRLLYRGYDVVELAEHSSFPEVAYLLIHGDLPTESQYEGWLKELCQWHEPPPEAIRVLEWLPEKTQALMLYRTMLSISACHIPESENTRLDAQWRRPPRVLSWCATLAAAAICHIKGIELTSPDDNRTFTDNFLKRALGREVSPSEIKAFDVSMVVQAEYGLHPAALAAVTTISTGADLGSAVLAGMGALSGRLHGGATRMVYQNLSQLESTEAAKKWVETKLEEKYRFPGFGHRIYKTPDPRALILEPYAKTLLEESGNQLLWEVYFTVREAVEAALGPEGIYINVEGVAGLIYHALGFPPESFLLPAALALQAGWMAHCLEYVAEGKMIEPCAIYTG